jgi:hypothetical protein
MKYTAEIYIKELNRLKLDINDIVQQPQWTSQAIKNSASDTLLLLASEIESLQKENVSSNPIELLKRLEQLRNQFTENEDKKRFEEYIAMLDSLINDGVK